MFSTISAKQSSHRAAQQAVFRTEPSLVATCGMRCLTHVSTHFVSGDRDGQTLPVSINEESF